MKNKQYRETLEEIESLLQKCWEHCRDNSDGWNRKDKGPQFEHNFPSQGGMIVSTQLTVDYLIDLCRSDLVRKKESKKKK